MCIRDSRSGALPAGIKYLEERTVGPSLGTDSIRHGVSAAIVGMLAVLIFMLIYYRAAGINADIALLLNLIIPVSYTHLDVYKRQAEHHLVNMQYFFAVQAGGGGMGWLSVAPLLFIFAIFYFLLILPQQRRQKKWLSLIHIFPHFAKSGSFGSIKCPARGGACATTATAVTKACLLYTSIRFVLPLLDRLNRGV